MERGSPVHSFYDPARDPILCCPKCNNYTLTPIRRCEGEGKEPTNFGRRFQKIWMLIVVDAITLIITNHSATIATNGSGTIRQPPSKKCRITSKLRRQYIVQELNRVSRLGWGALRACCARHLIALCKRRWLVRLTNCAGAHLNFVHSAVKAMEAARYTTPPQVPQSPRLLFHSLRRLPLS